MPVRRTTRSRPARLSPTPPPERQEPEPPPPKKPSPTPEPPKNGNGKRGHLDEGHPFVAQVRARLPKDVNADIWLDAARAYMASHAALYLPGKTCCSSESIQKAILNAASDGILLDDRHADMIPKYQKGQTLWRAVYIPRWWSVMRRLVAAGVADRMDVEAIHDNDEYKVDAANRTFIHTWDGVIRGSMVGMWSAAWKDGHTIAHVTMTIEEIEDVLDHINLGDRDSAWKGFLAEMAKKTVFRRMLKHLPVPDDLTALVHRDNDAYDWSRQNGAPPGQEAQKAGQEAQKAGQEAEAVSQMDQFLQMRGGEEEPEDDDLASQLAHERELNAQYEQGHDFEGSR